VSWACNIGAKASGSSGGFASSACDFGTKAGGGSGGSVRYDGLGWPNCDGFPTRAPSYVEATRAQAKSNDMAFIVAMSCMILYYG
jgi:hypothetical protein